MSFMGRPASRQIGAGGGLSMAGGLLKQALNARATRS
jgi:hypothetical protein